MIVWGTCIVNRPHKVVFSLTIEHISALSISPGLKAAAFWREINLCLGLDTYHIVIEFCTSHETITPIEVILSRNRVLEHINVNSLPPNTSRTVCICNDRIIESLERSHWIIADGTAYLLAV